MQNDVEGFMQVLAENQVGAKLGDKVRFTMPDANFVMVSMLFYIAPLVIGLIVLFFGLKILPMVFAKKYEVISAILAIMTFAVSIYVVNKKKLFKQDKDAYKVVITEILDK